MTLESKHTIGDNLQTTFLTFKLRRESNNVGTTQQKTHNLLYSEAKLL